MNSDAVVTRKTLAIRSAARTSLGLPKSDFCPTCGRPVADPYRRTVGARIAEGCVDASHSGKLIPGGYSEQWHTRDAAKKVRAMLLEGLS